MCWAVFIAILGHMWPVGGRLDTPARRLFLTLMFPFPLPSPLPTLKINGTCPRVRTKNKKN